MAESEDGSRKRDSHYSQQRSSHPSERSHTPSRPPSRPVSGQLASAYTLDDDYESPPDATNRASPAPNVPRLPHRKESPEKRRTWSRHGSAGGTARSGSKGRNVEDLFFPDASERGLDEVNAPAPVQHPQEGPRYGRHMSEEDDSDGLDEIEAPPPVQNPQERSPYQLHTIEDERSQHRDSLRPRAGQRQSRFSSFMHGRTTPGTLSSFTALPAMKYDKSSYSSFATELYSISSLILFAILGTLARLGVQSLTYYPGAPSTFPVLWANFGGTLVMGFLSQDRRLFREEWGHHAPSPPRTPRSDEEKAQEQKEKAASHAKVKKTIPLYIGLATGFCGSFTSFSSFMRDVFLAFLNDLRAPDTSGTASRSDGYSFMAGLAVIIITIAVCFSALKVGAHIAILLDCFTLTLPFRITRTIIDPIIVFIAWGAWLGAVFMAIWPPDRHGPSETWRGQAVFACVFAPLGCLLRYYVSLKINPISPSFPLGTFAVNIFGTAVLGMAYDLQHVKIGGSGVGGGRVGCQVLQGIMDGFDGCLTTVSTWILEIDGLRRAHAWRYAFASVAAGVCVLVVIMGSVRWSVGWTAVACVTGRTW